MPIYELSNALFFPPGELASADGIIAIGGDLKIERVKLAYENGIFPWPHEGYPLLWFCPDPRFVLEPRKMHLSKSLLKSLRKSSFRITFDTCFEKVISHCSKTKRPGQNGTWITKEMIQAYTKLYEEGFAHSVEVWEDEKLAGGLYGVSLGGIFFGESMFSLTPGASKAGFVSLVNHLQAWGFDLIDCQAETEHLKRFGANHMPRQQFLNTVRTSLANTKTKQGIWQNHPSLNAGKN